MTLKRPWAVRRKLGSADAKEIIHFVADARRDMIGTGFDVDPIAGEALVRAALVGDATQTEHLDPAGIVETEMLLLWKLLNTYSDHDLNLLLEEADALAARWSSP